MTKYICYFYMHGKMRRTELIRGITDVTGSTGGFWVDKNYRYDVPASKSVYWIPAHKVEFVEKISNAK